MAKQHTLTEAEWLTSVKHGPMWQFLGERLTPRKKLLFGCACARQTWAALTQEANRAAILSSELFADRRTTRKAQRAAWRAIEWEPPVYCEWPIDSVSGGVGYRDTSEADHATLTRAPYPGRRHDEQRDRDWCGVLRELFGNPFRPPPAGGPWLTPAARALARGLYDARDFAALPVLADALEDAGCDDLALLTHLRGPGPHFLGCWALDRVLGLS
jgi:hypothetical protein